MKKSIVHLENIEIDAVAGTMGEGKEQVGNEAEGRHQVVVLEYFTKRFWT